MSLKSVVMWIDSLMLNRAMRRLAATQKTAENVPGSSAARSASWETGAERCQAAVVLGIASAAAFVGQHLSGPDDVANVWFSHLGGSGRHWDAPPWISPEFPGGRR
jgi:hypothetical protein